MLKDIERGAPVEADHVIGDLLRPARRAARRGEPPSLLRVAYAHLKATRRARVGERPGRAVAPLSSNVISTDAADRSASPWNTASTLLPSGSSTKAP
jgi:hypothetical protein